MQSLQTACFLTASFSQVLKTGLSAKQSLGLDGKSFNLLSHAAPLLRSYHGCLLAAFAGSLASVLGKFAFDTPQTLWVAQQTCRLVNSRLDDCSQVLIQSWCVFDIIHRLF